MLPKEERVSKKLFDAAFKQSRAIHSPLWMVRVAPGPAGERSRFAIVSPKSVAKTAAERNRLRRAGYGIIAKHRSEILPGHVFLCFFKKEAIHADVDMLEDDFGKLLGAHGFLA